VGCTHRSPPETLGVDLPLAGPDGAEGILALQAVRLAVEQRGRERGGPPALDVRDASAGGLADPHEDEGSGNWRNAAHAAQNVRSLAKNSHVLAVIGGFSDAIARTERDPATRAHLPILLANAPGARTLSLDVFQFSRIHLGASQLVSFERAYRARYKEASDAVAARYYLATHAALACLAPARNEVANCLRKANEWNL